MNSCLENSERDAGDWFNAGIAFFGLLIAISGVLTSCLIVGSLGVLMLSWVALWFYVREGI